MSTIKYTGARYLVKFVENWTSENAYEPITAVQVNGFTYISKCPVPAGVEITNTDFWLVWADPNSQMEQLRQLVVEYIDDVETYDGRINDNAQAIADEIAAREQAIADEIAAREQADNNIINSINDTYQANTCLVNDIEDYVTVPQENNQNIQVVCLAYDQASDTMYIVNRYNNDTQALIRAITNFSAYNPGDTVSIARRVIIDSLHPNSMTYDNGKLYVFDYDTQNIQVVNASNLTYEKTITWGQAIRSGAMKTSDQGNKIFYIQPVTANYMFKMYTLTSDKDNLNKAIGLKMPLNAGMAWVQDAEVYKNAYVRLCSMNNSEISNPYIEFNTLGYSQYPIVVPINFNTEWEWEGITFGASYAYLNYSNKICRSQQLTQIYPQVGTINQLNNWWQSSIEEFGLSPALHSTGLNYTQIGTEYTVTIPYELGVAIWNNHAENPLLLMHCGGIGFSTSSQRLGANLLIPLTEVIANNRNITISGNITNGNWVACFLVWRTGGSNFTDYVIHVKFNTFTEYSFPEGGGTVTAIREDTRLQINDPKFRLIR